MSAPSDVRPGAGAAGRDSAREAATSVQAHTHKIRERLEPKYSSHMLLTPANAFTLLRMACTPIVLLLMIEHRVDISTFALWVVVSGTDWIDGKLARRYGISKSGAFLDPLADKVLVLGGLAVLVWHHVFWWLPVVVIAAREVAMSAYRSVLARKGISVPARKLAKYKTFVQQAAVAAAVAPWLGNHALWFANTLLWVSVVLTVVSFAMYLLDARRPGNQ